MATWGWEGQESGAEGMTYDGCLHWQALAVGSGFLVALVGWSQNKCRKMNWGFASGLRFSEADVISKNTSSSRTALPSESLAGAEGSGGSGEGLWPVEGQDVNDKGQIQSYYLLSPSVPTSVLRKAARAISLMTLAGNSISKPGNSWAAITPGADRSVPGAQSGWRTFWGSAVIQS